MPIVTLVCALLGIVAPYFIALGFGGLSTGEVSDQFFADVLIIPADYAFTIWTPIYLGFLGFAVYQLLPSQRDNPRFQNVRSWFAASMLLNGVWILIFDNLLFTLSMLVIVAMLVTALVMHQRLEIGNSNAVVDRTERVIRVAFSLYAAWLTAATILNVSGVLSISGWNGFGLPDNLWATFMLIIALVLALAIRVYWRDPVYGAVFVWTFIAIAVTARSGPLVTTVAVIGAFVMLMSLLPAVNKRATRVLST
jgi:hypothetical protein